MKTEIELPKYGIFYFENTNPDDRKYWIGTYTKDRSACDKKIEFANGYGKSALKDAQSILKRLNKSK